MNTISKELRVQINKKVYKAFGQKDEIDIDKANAKYRTKIKEIAKIHQEYEQKTKELSEELKAENLYLNDYSDNFKIEASQIRRDSEAEEIIQKVIVALQYSKEPDFLSSIDKLITQFVPKKEQISV